MSSLAIGTLFSGVVLVWTLRASKRRRRERARELASVLITEIRAIVTSSDRHGATGGETPPAEAYARLRGDVGRVLPREASFAVETFYGTVEAYEAARRASDEAFRDGSGLSLGDRIRAKDQRDRCLKDLYYTGESAAQKLEAIAG